MGLGCSGDGGGDGCIKNGSNGQFCVYFTHMTLGSGVDCLHSSPGFLIF